MCFSAGASFSAAAILSTAGVVSIKQANSPGQMMFASIPLLFGLQQACEGLLWMALSHPHHYHWQHTATYCFLFFAQVLWPTWVPAALLLLEKHRAHKKWWQATIIAGIACSLLLAFRLIAHPVSVQIKEHHIDYELQSSTFVIVLSNVLYVLSTAVPPFLSGLRGMKTLGITLIISIIVTKLFYTAYFISVWCFFSALLSVQVIFILRWAGRETQGAIRDLRHSS